MYKDNTLKKNLGPHVATTMRDCSLRNLFQLYYYGDRSGLQAYTRWIVELTLIMDKQ